MGNDMSKQNHYKVKVKLNKLPCGGGHIVERFVKAESEELALQAAELMSSCTAIAVIGYRDGNKWISTEEALQAGWDM